MKIPVGEKVVILENGETGVIQYYDGNTAFIDVDGEIVQVHKNDIEAVEFFGKISKHETPKEIKPRLLSDDGIHLQFTSIKNFSGEIQRFDLFLMNNTDTDLLCEYQYYLDQTQQTVIRKEINKFTTLKLNEFKTDHLNDRPIFDFSFWPRNVQKEFEFHFQKALKLKAKNYFAILLTKEFIESGFFTLLILKDIPQVKTKMEIPELVHENDDLFYPKKSIKKENEVVIKASLPDFIDLHAENLVPGFRDMDATEILHHQLNHFKNFLEKAIRFNLHKIYAVHGIGKGVLKAEISKILQNFPEVESFNNDYNPRFGFGATEIFLD